MTSGNENSSGKKRSKKLIEWFCSLSAASQQKGCCLVPVEEFPKVVLSKQSEWNGPVCLLSLCSTTVMLFHNFLLNCSVDGVDVVAMQINPRNLLATALKCLMKKINLRDLSQSNTDGRNLGQILD